MRYKFAIIEIGELRIHEAFQDDLLESCIKMLEDDGVFKYPILVDENYLVVLDGHHRVEALKRMGYTKIPVYKVDYWDDAIEVTTWPEAEVENINKEMIIDMGRSEDVYPPKTSRHVLKIKLEEHPVPLEELR
ncbi:MAG: ParB N-terminal domain-containing protein [Methanobacteriota archaeon]|nr:MAG: ParB N-terminal domain-containing protein [Euryarchaeota archaeon]